MSRRAAIFLHAHDVEDVRKKGTSSTNLNKPSGKPREQPLEPSSGRPSRNRSEKSHGSVTAERSSSATPAESESSQRRRRKSVALQVRRPSTLPEMSTCTAPPRRQSIRRNSTLASMPAAYTAYGPSSRRASIKPPPPPPKEEPALTKQQVAAFKEVFDLFDSNGGGTIDAEELQQALASVDIFLSEEEINDVLKTIDKDGSGEIDFEEFLTMMTNTEKFLEMFASKHEGDGKVVPEGIEGREMILFDALTQFMKSSALKQMDEIVGYYNTKYKRAQAPHVVMHYAAGARLIGLTEKQLVQHMKLLQQSNRENNYQSPYAQPLRFILMGPPRKPVKKRVPNVALPSQEQRCTGKIKLKIRIVYKNDENGEDQSKGEGDGDHVGRVGEEKMGRLTKRNSYLSVYKPRLGWVNSHVKSIEQRLPKTHFVTALDLPKIRKSISDATREYHRELTESKRTDNLKYWKSLHPELIPSKKLRNNFRKVFNAYIPLDAKQ